MLACLAKISPLDPATGNRVDIYVASANDRTITGLNGQVWEPAMINAPSIGIALWNGDFTDSISVGAAVLPLNMSIVKMTYPAAESYAWIGAPVEIYAEKPGTAWPWATRLKGKITTISGKGASKSLTAEVDTEPFKANVLNLTYAGTGGAEGPISLANTPKPLIIGRASNVEPLLIDADNSVYQFSAYGPIEAVSILYERGSSFGASVGDYATYALLVAANIPAGRWGSCLAEGMIRLGAPAFGVITGDVRGYAIAGVTPRLTGKVIQALATVAGVSSSLLNTSSLDAMDTAAPYPINIVLTEQVTFLDIAQELALCCNAQSGISLTGIYFASRITLTGTEVLTLDAQGKAYPPVTSSEEMTVSPPYWRTILGAARCWRVHSPSDIASSATLNPRGRYLSTTTYREGDWVTVDDGSEWLFVATTATSGVAPPAWPTTSNATWQNLNPPSAAAITGYLTNSAVTVPADASGAVSSFSGAGGSLVVKKSGVQITTGITYSLVSSTGVTISINSTTGAYSVTAMSADSGTATLRAVYDVYTFDLVYTISKAKAGAAGSPGSNSALVYAYKRAASAPSDNPGAVTFDFTTGTISTATLANSWSKTIPGGSNPLYVIVASAVSSTSTDSIAAGEWGAPVMLAQDGLAGLNVSTVFLYRRTTTNAAPSVTTTGSATYTFASGAITGQPASWSAAVPSAAGGGYLWVIQATASSTGATDTLANTEWSAPVLITQDGAAGADGSANALVFVYQRAASAPAVPSATVTYTFATGALTGLNNGWTATIPAGTNPLYVTVATASSSGASDTIGTAEWAAPVILVQDGLAGLNVATVNLYQRTSTATAPSVATTGNTTYTFATGGATGRPSGWTVAVPDESAGKYLWTIQATAAATTATDLIANTEWAAPVLVAKSGDNGTDGTSAISGYLTNEVLSVFAYADGTVVAYTGATGQFRVFSGSTDISSSFTLSTQANPQALTIGYTGQTYTISGGMDANEDVASVTIRATGSGAFTGITIDKVVSLSKTKGGYEIVSTLPTANLFVGRVVFLTTDGQLYRYLSGGWTTAVPAANISGSLTSAQIGSLDAVKLTGTLGADLFAANTIAAGKILAMDTNNMVADPQFTDIGASTGTNYWGLSDWTIIDSGSHLTSLGIPRGVRTPDGSTLSVAPPAVVSQMGPAATRISVEAGKPYRIYARAQLSTGFTGWARIGVRWYDKDGVECATGSPSRISAIGGSDYRVTASTGGVTCIFDGVVTAPADAVYARFLNYVTWSETTTKPGLTANVGFATYGAPRMMRAMNAELVVDGQIKAIAIDAGAVTTNKLDAAAVTAAKIGVTSLSAIAADVGTLTAGIIRNAADTHRLDVTNGRTITKVGTAWMKVTGAPFGSAAQFIEWYGPYFSNLNSCTEANATYYLKTDGSAYFGGSLLAGVLKNEATASDTTATSSVVVGPFGSNGGTRVVTASYFYSYNANISDAGAYTGSATATFVLERWNGSGYVQLGTQSVTGNINWLDGNGTSEPGFFRYTMSGSITFTDTTGGTSAQYRVRVTARTLPTVTSTVIGSAIVAQRVSGISTEQ